MTLRLLLFVDDVGERASIARELQRDFPNAWINAIADRPSCRRALVEETFHLVMIAQRLTWATPLDALRLVKAKRPDCPVLFWLETAEEQFLLAAMREGLTDYVLKTPAQMLRLATVVRLALTQFRQRQALLEAESRYQSLFENVPVGLYRSTPQGELRDVNPAFVKTLGYERREELLAHSAAELYVDLGDRQRWQGRMQRDGEVRRFETRLRRRDGSALWVMEHARAIFGRAGEVVCYEGTIESIAERKQAEESLRRKTAQLQAITTAMASFLERSDFRTALAPLLEVALEQTDSPYGFVGMVEGLHLRVVAEEGIIDPGPDAAAYHERNRHQLAVHGFVEFPNLQHLLGQPIRLGEAVRANSLEAGGFRELPDGHPPLRSFLGVPILTGGRVPVHGAAGVLGVANRPGGYGDAEQDVLEIFAQPIGLLLDQFRRLQHEREMEMQLRQAHKMEAVGRLAGGVAHDFNNLLTAIMGYSEMLLDEVAANDPVAEGLQEIYKVGERAVALTRQLLAFGRKAAQQPRIVDLNRLVRDLDKMLHRLIGEDIELATELTADPHCVRADPSYLEQVIVNLVVNARDAINAAPRSVGERRITVGTINVCVTGEAHYASDIQPGEYVQLTVSDTGCGMTEEIRQRIFEPFFTTKEQRKGTGLGLATVYGIVKQSEGHIRVSSTLGQGTVFRLYFPANSQTPEARPEPEQVRELKLGTETLLIVEDDENLRGLLQTLFKQSGYTLLLAPTGEDALRLAEAHSGSIDLLLADVVLPRLSGPDLAKRLKAARPNMKVLYMSGYALETVSRKGWIPPETLFLQKPFTPAVILHKVRDVLDR